MLTTILFSLVIAAYVAANIILSVIAIKEDCTISELIVEQDFGLGKIGVSIMYWPTFVVLYIRSLRPVDTNYSFDKD